MRRGKDALPADDPRRTFTFPARGEDVACPYASRASLPTVADRVASRAPESPCPAGVTGQRSDRGSVRIRREILRTHPRSSSCDQYNNADKPQY